LKIRTIKGNGLVVSIKSDKDYDYVTVQGDEKQVNEFISRFNAKMWMERTLPSFRRRI
jgi:hypothetical protein